MKVWPTISHTTLETCNSGEIVRVVESSFPDYLAIVCKNRDVGYDLIALRKNELVCETVEDTSLLEVFRYECDPILMLDHTSSFSSYDEEIWKKMGLVVFVKSGCYLTVNLASSSKKSECRFNTKSKLVDSAYGDDDHEGLAFKNWRIVLVNPYMLHADPVEIFSMQLS